MSRSFVFALALVFASGAHALDGDDHSENRGAPSARSDIGSELPRTSRQEEAKRRPSMRLWTSIRASVRINDFSPDGRMRDLGFRDTRLVHYGLD